MTSRLSLCRLMLLLLLFLPDFSETIRLIKTICKEIHDLVDISFRRRRWQLLIKYNKFSNQFKMKWLGAAKIHKKIDVVAKNRLRIFFLIAPSAFLSEFCFTHIYRRSVMFTEPKGFTLRVAKTLYWPRKCRLLPYLMIRSFETCKPTKYPVNHLCLQLEC